jgi:hypothetical protein
MQWTVTTPPSDPILTYTDLAYHMRLDPEVSAASAEQTYVLNILAAAIEYAETAMAASLASRTITATVYSGDLLNLPRGPVASLVSVSDPSGPLSGTSIQTTGNTDTLIVPNGWGNPLTVVYTAGYPTGAVPADIVHAIRMHVSSLYNNRESVTDKATTAVPQSLADFYARKARSSNLE